MTQPARSRRLRWYQLAVSIFIAGVLLGQAAVLVPGFSWGTRITWPIVSYHMYSRSRGEGEAVEVRHLMEAALADGQVVELTPESLNLSLWDYRHLTQRLLDDESEASALLRSQYRRGEELVELRIKTFPVIVTRNGPQAAPSQVVKRIAFVAPPQAQPQLAGQGRRR